MKSRESLIRLHRFQVDEKRRQVADIESMLEDFQRKERDLEAQVVQEQEKAGISDVAHYAYPMFAKSMRARRDNMIESMSELSRQLEQAREELADAYRELKKYELVEQSRQRRAKREAARIEQNVLDEVSLNMHRQNMGG
ncbi:flagellar export protein FliJ [Tepidicaulis marinus]|uniref:Flagellar FliJ protein n=1 Tax=Tepidicaulis marinus TaxID=1333998 RepID=A0A081BEK8_9HYPH|nr:flagellar FliJ family protein [Tepidicaulis marinus]GAK46476.1 flagellar export protein FliJ [Tepidicaulis marinus]